MKVLCYSTKSFEPIALAKANEDRHELHHIPDALSIDTAKQAQGFDAISIFTNDDASAPVVSSLGTSGIRYITTRSAGYDNIDLAATLAAGIKVANVPAYSPYSVAEFSVALLMALNRKIILSNTQMHSNDFRVDSLFGFDIHNKTVGIIGTGKIGAVAASIYNGLGCTLLGYDIDKDTELEQQFGMSYVSLEELCRQSDIITLHLCLNEHTKYLINSSNIKLMKNGVVVINTARGAVVKTEDVIAALEEGKIGAYGADVYEHEKGLFFYDHSGKKVNDEMLLKLMSMPNALITPHQAFATQEALENIMDTTIQNLDCWERQEASPNEL